MFPLTLSDQTPRILIHQMTPFPNISSWSLLATASPNSSLDSPHVTNEVTVITDTPRAIYTVPMTFPMAHKLTHSWPNINEEEEEDRRLPGLNIDEEEEEQKRRRRRRRRKRRIR
jgi:hypothetical protein